MKFIVTLIALTLSLSVSAQTYIQGAIYVTSNDVTVRVKPNQLISQSTGAVVSFNLTVSVNSNGQPIGNAPAPSALTCYIPGATVINAGVSLIDNRFTYTFTLTGNATSAINWPANTEQDLLFIDFPGNAIMTGQFPRLEDQTNDGGGPTQQSTYYADFNGFDYTNYTNLFYAGGGGSLGTDSNGDQYVQSGTALPIKLTDFAVAAQADRTARLTWYTEREQNSDYFGIERSSDGITWEKIGSVQAAGYSSKRLFYEFLDMPLPKLRSKKEIYFYRLKMTDLDGTFAYSEVRAVDFRNTTQPGELRVFPNPANQILHVDLSGWDEEEPNRVRMVDGMGKIVLDEQNAGQGIISFNTDMLANGFYMIVVNQGQKTVSERVVIAR